MGAFFTQENIEFTLIVTGIWPSICTKKLPNTSAKKFYVRFVVRTILSSHAICQLAGENHLNVRNNCIQAILRESKQLAVNTNYLNLENKRQNRGKRLNLLDEEDDNL